MSTPEPTASLDVALAHATRLLQSDPALAAEQAAEVLKVAPGHPLALLVLGAAHTGRGQVQAALDILEPLAVSQPNWAMAQLEYGLALGGAGRGDEAVATTPEFKGNLNARYSFDLAGGESFVQAALSHQGDRTVDLRDSQQSLFGMLDAFTEVDLSAGYRRNNWSIDLFLKNATDERSELTRFSQCAALTCGYQPYTVVSQPRTLGIRFSQEF